MTKTDPTSDVLIIGAGPVGLSLANLLGMRGVSVTVLEALPKLIDYPRGVGIDDESLRSLQTMGLVEKALPFTTPSHIMRLVNGKGRRITEIRPTTDEFGWSRRNAFIQPEIDRVLFEGLERFPHVTVLFGHEVSSISDDGAEVTVSGTTLEGESFRRTASYLVGSDGGRSRTRKHMGVSFEGQSPSTRWLVVDVRDDPIGTPNIYLGGDPRRPYVSLGLPQAIRRFEFMLFDDEPDSLVEDDGFVEKLLADHVPDPLTVDIVRARVYTHHSRIAGDFRKGRIFIAGDAAHLMPVWQGQGWNSGERDATNLAWKLAAVVTGQCDDRLLDTYHAERHAHAKAMIDLSTAFGRVVKPTNRVVAALRDAAASALNSFPAARDYFAQMKYKPMPRYTTGAIVTGEPTDLHVRRSSPNKTSPVGTQLIQPNVVDALGATKLLDDVIGYRWAVLQWGGNPERLFSDEQRETLRRLGAVLVSVRPVVQMEIDQPQDADAVVVGDVTGRLKAWFDDRDTPVLFLRPDRFIAATALAQQAGTRLEELAAAVHLHADAAAIAGEQIPARAEIKEKV
ncbi:bifunctional 3-(3-hydroxy-phenyl)propionate/3-hydroxycinnamic acid hydroxylase [Microbacterium sediminicola]|uniref:Bifunctional 3-(3-hydroxy-phenyl)propionate/3-hydroxycinnamic acid hydroxylase n=2 Tax=Microbacterium sediminicola TaxID=415210 RepID=A0ABN2I791_9MICO